MGRSLSRSAASKGLEKGVRVHYIDRAVIAEQVALPLILPFFFTFRKVLIQEGVSIVHAINRRARCHECIGIARALGYKTVLTEHSLYESPDFFSFDNLVNTFLRITLCHVDQVICVSDKCRENLIKDEVDRKTRGDDDPQCYHCRGIPSRLFQALSWLPQYQRGVDVEAGAEERRRLASRGDPRIVQEIFPSTGADWWGWSKAKPDRVHGGRAWLGGEGGVAGSSGSRGRAKCPRTGTHLPQLQPHRELLHLLDGGSFVRVEGG